MLEKHKLYSSLIDHFDPVGLATLEVERLYELMETAKFFSEFSQADIDKLAMNMDLYNVPPDTMIIREGDLEDFMLLILDGTVKISKLDPAGNQRTVSIASNGASLGEMSVVDGEPRFASCTTTEDTTFVILRRAKMVNLIVSDPAFGCKILAMFVSILSKRVRETSIDLIQSLQSDDKNFV